MNISPPLFTLSISSVVEYGYGYGYGYVGVLGDLGVETGVG